MLKKQYKFKKTFWYFDVKKAQIVFTAKQDIRDFGI